MDSSQGNSPTQKADASAGTSQLKSEAKPAGAALDLQALNEQAAKLTGASASEQTKEFSAATIARMMGVATISDLQVIEKKVDLLMSKLALISTRMEKALTVLNDAPKGSDFERMEVQIGSLKSLIRDTLTKADASVESVRKLGEEAGTKDKIAQFLSKDDAQGGNSVESGTK